MITKAEAAQITFDYHTWEQKAQEFIDVVDNSIRYQAQHGFSEVTMDIPSNLAEESINMAFETIRNAGFDLEQSTETLKITIKWTDIAWTGSV